MEGCCDLNIISFPKKITKRGICIKDTVESFFYQNKIAQIKPDNGPKKQVELSSEDDFDD